MQILLAATVVSYAVATFFRVREKVAGNPMKNHSRASILLGVILNIALLYITADSLQKGAELQTGSFMISASLSLALCTFAIELWMREIYFSIFSLPVCIVFLLTSLLATGKISGEQFAQPWFIIHLVTSIAGECFFMIASISSATYLYVVRRLKKKNKLKAVFLFPPLNRLDNLTYKLILAGTLTFLVGLSIGLYGNYSHFDNFHATAKHYYSGALFLFYFLILILRKPLKLAGPRLAIAAVIGLILSLGLILIPGNELHWQPEKASSNQEVAR